MKLPVLVLGLLLLAMLLAPAGHGAHNRRGYPIDSHNTASQRLLPLRVLRTSQPPHKVVRMVKP